MSRYKYHFCSAVNIYIYFFPDRYALLSELKCIPFSLLKNIQRKLTNVRYTRQCLKTEKDEVKEIRHFQNVKHKLDEKNISLKAGYMWQISIRFFFFFLKKNIIMMSKHSPYNSLGMRYWREGEHLTGFLADRKKAERKYWDICFVSSDIQGWFKAGQL